MKKGSIRVILTLLIFLVAGCTSFSTSDKKSDKSSTEDTNKKSEEVAKSDESKSNEGSASGKGDQDSSFEQNITLPDAFPSDIPIPKDVELFITENDTNDQTLYLVSYVIEGKVIDYYKMYREYIEQAGYTNIIDASGGNADLDTKQENILATLGENRLAVGVIVKGTGKYDDGTIRVSLSYMIPKK